MRLRSLPALFLISALVPCSNGETRQSQTVPNQTQRTTPTVQPAPDFEQPVSAPPALTPSTNGAINSTCGLDSVKKSLDKQKDNNKRAKLIREFNSCVKSHESENGPPPPPPPPPPVNPGGGGGQNAGVGGGTGAAQQQHTQGQQLTGSAWGTPDACATGTTGALAAKGILFVHRSLVLPHQATDDFGYRLGKRFLVYQVTVTNAATDFQYSVSDIVVDLKPIYTKLKVPLLNTDPTDVPTPAAYEASSQDLSMLRGVPEKGQDYDPRNMTLHILQGVGAVGAGISGLTPFSDVMGSAMANFNGAFLQAFTGIAPDHTATQLNRLSDKAFTSNTLIGKLQTKTFAIFIPEQLVMPKGDQRTYWKDPRTELSTLPFDQLNVCVDGILLVQAATAPDPTFSTTEANVAPGTAISLADDPSATIYLTTNGDTPTTSSSKYSTPIVVGAVGTPPVTIKAFAVIPNESPSNTVVKTFAPAQPAQKPTITCGADKKSATIAPVTVNDTVFYTVDGTPPTRASTAITAATTVTFSSASETINAIEVGNNTSLSSPVTQACPGP
jgi:Fn3 associated